MKILLNGLVEQVIRAVSGGSRPADSKYPPDYIADLIPQGRQTALSIFYNGAGDTSGLGNLKMGANRMIPPDFYQTFTLYLDESAQDSSLPYLKFDCPSPIAVNRDVNGFSAVYNISKTDSKRIGKIKPCRNVNEFLGKVGKSGLFYVSIDGQVWTTGDPNLKQIEVVEVCSNPIEAPGFNQQFDPYPYPMELMSLLVQVLKRDYLREENVTPKDYVSNSNQPNYGK